jgi:dTDP-4-amino-4,6-dideoxygalactose transaminase
VSGSPIPFLDLRPSAGAAHVRHAIDRVIDRGWFVLGPEVEAFETAFAAASGAKSCVGVATGTDAITLLLRASGIGPGDEVIVPALTAAYTALAVIAAGASPVIVDVDDDTLTMSADACAAAVTSKTRAIVPVHLYGQPADMAALRTVAEQHALLLIEDCCQAHLATSSGVPVGTTGGGGAFSFYPTKNLGALGDGGAVVTNDAAVADRVRLLRNGGQRWQYHHEDVGVNSRLDEIQAAVLRAKLPALAAETARRRALAARYRQGLPSSVQPVVEHDGGHVYHLFPVRHPERDALRHYLRERGIETLIHYPSPLSAQPALERYARSSVPVAARAARELLSLPLYPGLADADVDRVVEAVTTWSRFERGHVLA